MQRHATTCSNGRISVLVFAGESAVVNLIEEDGTIDAESLPEEPCTVHTPDEATAYNNAAYAYETVIEAFMLLDSDRYVG